jgi:hypothetical protein
LRPLAASEARASADSARCVAWRNMSCSSPILTLSSRRKLST